MDVDLEKLLSVFGESDRVRVESVLDDVPPYEYTAKLAARKQAALLKRADALRSMAPVQAMLDSAKDKDTLNLLVSVLSMAVAEEGEVLEAVEGIFGLLHPDQRAALAKQDVLFVDAYGLEDLVRLVLPFFRRAIPMFQQALAALSAEVPAS